MALTASIFQLCFHLGLIFSGGHFQDTRASTSLGNRGDLHFFSLRSIFPLPCSQGATTRSDFRRSSVWTFCVGVLFFIFLFPFAHGLGDSWSWNMMNLLGKLYRQSLFEPYSAPPPVPLTPGSDSVTRSRAASRRSLPEERCSSGACFLSLSSYVSNYRPHRLPKSARVSQGFFFLLFFYFFCCWVIQGQPQTVEASTG